MAEKRKVLRFASYLPMLNGVGHSRRKEAWELVEVIRNADRLMGATTLGQICARGVVMLDVAYSHCHGAAAIVLPG